MVSYELCWRSRIFATWYSCQVSSHWDAWHSNSSLFVLFDWERQVFCHKHIAVPHFYANICESAAFLAEGIEIQGSELERPNIFANCRCSSHETHSTSLQHFMTLHRFWVSLFVFTPVFTPVPTAPVPHFFLSQLTAKPFFGLCPRRKKKNNDSDSLIYKVVSKTE